MCPRGYVAVNTAKAFKQKKKDQTNKQDCYCIFVEWMEGIDTIMHSYPHGMIEISKPYGPKGQWNNIDFEANPFNVINT